MQVSIITPVLNAERHIVSCIENVRLQNNGNIEHIIVDGGSSDRTVAIVEDIARSYSCLKLIRGPDKGQSDAMNKGIKSASAGIIGILNVDDKYETGTISRAFSILVNEKIPSLVIANCRVADEHGDTLFWNKPSDLRLKRLLLGGDVAPFPANPCAYFYHKSVHNIVGYYDTAEHYAMDVDFIFACSARVNVTYRDEYWGTYYQYPETKTVMDRPNSRNRIRNLKKKYISELSLIDKAYVTSRIILYRAKNILNL